jgi:protein SCO1/2
MNQRQRILAWLLWGVLILAMLGAVGTVRWGRVRQALPPINRISDAPAVLYPAPSFSLTDQEGRPFSSESLRGKAWVADFIFTNCPGACPMMGQKISSLQKAVPNENVRFVSFTVDPETDTPEVLKQYGQRFGADGARWHFLTGEKREMFRIAAEMKLSALPAEGTNPIVHSEKFLLVDKDGNVRGAYDSGDEEDIKRLVRDAAALGS